MEYMKMKPVPAQQNGDKSRIKVATELAKLAARKYLETGRNAKILVILDGTVHLFKKSCPSFRQSVDLAVFQDE